MPLPSLTVTQLFTPAPSGVSNAGAIPSLPASGSWLSIEYEIAAIVQLPTTAWQSGGPERTILAINAVCLSQDDALVSMMAQGAFLSSAATGTVTYQTLQSAQLVTVTVPVTPDPSIPSQNSTGAPGWLDVLGESVYDVTRLGATYAAGPLAIVNTSGSTVGPYVAGGYHVAGANGANYSNTASLTIPAGSIAGSSVSSVGVGMSSTTIGTSSPHGLSVGQSVWINIPTSSGISGLSGVFANVATASTSSFSVALGSSGTYTGSAGLVWTCTVATMAAAVIGTGSSAAPGAVTTTVTQNAGVYCGNVTPWSASNWESNLAYAARCQESLAAASPNGPSQAYVYFAKTAQQILAAETPPIQLTNGAIIAANEYASPVTGIVTTVIASSTPASTTLGQAVTPGFAQNPVTGVSNASAAVVTVANAVAAWSGTASVIIADVLGIGGVNGAFNATYLTPTTFSIPVNTSASASYTGGGGVEGGDLGQVDNLLQENVVPDGILAITESALAQPITVIASVTVPQAYAATYATAAPIAVSVYLASLPFGGVVNPSITVPISYDEIVAALIDAGVLALGQATYVIGTPIVTVNGAEVDVAFVTNQYQALLSSLALTVVGV